MMIKGLEVLLWSLCLHCLPMLGESTSLTYALTVRDFLPHWCSSLRSDTRPGDDFLYDIPIALPCPYRDEIIAGTISGHPDFDRIHLSHSIPGYFTDANKIDGNEGFILPGSTEGNPFFEKTVEEYTEIASSGLPKPAYCTGNTLKGFNGTTRCGLFGNPQGAFSTTNKKYFDMWYNDDIRYSRRLGVPLNLKPGVNPFEFLYLNSDPENEFNPTATRFYAPHAHLKYTEEEYPDPMTVPNWPKDSVQRLCYNNDAQAQQLRLWHTTEIHTFFEYRKDEVFTFTGDDDAWVYINGILAVDLSGIHGTVTQSIDLGRDFAAEHFNLSIGGIYTFDMFQAERKCSGSNFGITTTLAAPCNIAKEAAPKRQFEAKFDLTLDKVEKSNGVTLHPGGTFTLASPGLTSTSFLWLKEPVNVGTGFVVEFDFNVTGETDGFAFVLHRRPEGLAELPISQGSSLGYEGLANSLAIAFELCNDGEVPGTPCSGQRLSLNYPESQGSGGTGTDHLMRVHDRIMLSLRDNKTHSVKIDYFFSPPAIEVTLDGSLYLREMPFSAIEVFGSWDAFAGFTGAGGVLDQPAVSISNFKVTSMDVEASQTQTTDFPENLLNFSRKPILADNLDSDGFTLQTHDWCGRAVESGGRTANTRAVYVERLNAETGTYHNGRLIPNVIDADVEDNNNGKYKYTMKTEVGGNYSLFVYYGNPGDLCDFSISREFINSGSSGISVEFVNISMDPSSNANCYFAQIEDALEAISLTEPPTLQPTREEKETDGYVPLLAGICGGLLVACAGVVAAGVKRRRSKSLQDSKLILGNSGF